LPGIDPKLYMCQRVRNDYLVVGFPGEWLVTGPELMIHVAGM